MGRQQNHVKMPENSNQHWTINNYQYNNLQRCFYFLSVALLCCCRLFTWSEYSLYKTLAYWIFLQQHPNLQVGCCDHSSVLCNKSNYFRIWLILSYDLLFLYHIKRIDSLFPCICPVIDHQRRQNVVRIPVIHLPYGSRATFFLFLPHSDFICDLLLKIACWRLKLCTVL